MFYRANSGIFQSSLLSTYSQFVHGFSGRQFGDMNLVHSKKRICDLYSLDFMQLVRLHQVHGDAIALVKDSVRELNFENFDGAIYTGDTRSTPILCITSADCVPVLVFDPERKFFGVVHSGWRGTMLHITEKLVNQMKEYGSNLNDIFVIMGPYIHDCCYRVAKERSDLFGPAGVSYRNNNWYIDLGDSIAASLLKTGISREHIDQSDMCTSCMNDEFFSYRKESQTQLGMNLSFITFK